MNKKIFMIILLAIAILTLNFSVAADMDNSTNDELSTNLDNPVNQSVLKSSQLVKTEIDVVSNTTFDVVGSDFKVRLVDENKTPISNKPVKLVVNGATFNRTTNEKGLAVLKLRLSDGSYSITTKFLGDSVYKASSKTTKVTINNTRIVDEGLSNSRIQEIIDNAKPNNVILFKGDIYNDVNLIINKSVSLVSNSNTVLQSSSSAPVITIHGKAASLAKVKGFKIKGNGKGIFINQCDYVTISNNEISSEGDGITLINTTYLNITKNTIANGKIGIMIVDDDYTYITDNDISNNEKGIVISKSNNTYVYSNSINSNKIYGITATNSINCVDYGEGPENLNIVQNTISNNGDTGIDLTKTNGNLKILGNTINANKYRGISMSSVGSNLIQSNVLSNHKHAAIEFTDDYIRPEEQEVSYNAFVLNTKDLEAKDSVYDEAGNQLRLEDNWHTDRGFVCPKINTGRIKLQVSHLGGDYFQATFLDSNGNVASLLPDRTLTYQTDDGQMVSITVSGGISVFKVNGVSADTFNSTTDYSKRSSDYEKDTSSDAHEYRGESPQYSYPNRNHYDYYEDMGYSSGDAGGDGSGNGGNANNGNGNSPNKRGDFTGNGTTSKKANPSKKANSQVNDVSQSYETQSTTSPASSSQSVGVDASDSAGGEKQSVVKQILIDEDDIFRVTGISFIILLIILTIGYYYKDDIKEMKSKL